MPTSSPTTWNTLAASFSRWASDNSGRCSFRLRSTPCWTRNTGLIEPNGSWNTIGTMLLYRSWSRRARTRESGLPSK